SRGGEGKSVTALNLAHAMARSDRRVCLVDADLRRPSVARYLNIEGAVGLTTVLIGRATIDDVLQPVGADGLMVLPAGRTPPNASELLGSAAMHDLVDALEERFDTVIFDCAPLLPVTDAAVLSRATDGVLLVVGSGIVNRDQLGETATKLETVGARVLGFVLNRTRRGREVHAYGYHPHAVDLDAGETAVRQGADADHAAPAGADPDQPVPARTELPGTTVEGTGENPEESTPPAEATPLDDARATPPEKGTTNDALPSPPEPERATTPGVPSSGGPRPAPGSAAGRPRTSRSPRRGTTCRCAPPSSPRPCRHASSRSTVEGTSQLRPPRCCSSSARSRSACPSRSRTTSRKALPILDASCGMLRRSPSPPARPARASYGSPHRGSRSTSPRCTASCC